MPESPLEFIRNNAAIFARCGAVVASYRTRGTAQYGPYFRVAYRIAGSQCSIYLGRSAQLADRVRELLTELQQPRNFRRMCQKADRLRRATLRRVIRQWQQTIRAYGLDLRGCEVRGWRAFGLPRIDKTTPLNAAQKAAAAILRSPPPPLTPDNCPLAKYPSREPKVSPKKHVNNETYGAGNLAKPTPTKHTRYWQNSIPVDQLNPEPYTPTRPAALSGSRSARPISASPVALPQAPPIPTHPLRAREPPRRQLTACLQERSPRTRHAPGQGSAHDISSQIAGS